MPAIRILTETELRQQVELNLESVDRVEAAFAALAGGAVVMPPILHMALPEQNGEVDVKTAYVPGAEGFAIKVSPGFFDNPQLGLPSLNGLMMLLNAGTGMVDAMLLDNGYLTDIRTAAAGAIAARHMSRPDANSAGVLGAGVQACLQLEALTLVRPIQRAKLWARRHEQAQATAAELSQKLEISVDAVTSARAAVHQQDIVVTCTPSNEPLVEAGWLEPGQHITAMGADAHYKNELAPAVISRVDLYVCDRQSQCALVGELHHALAAGLVPADAVFPELGAVVTGVDQGRSSAADITVVDLTGTGVQDTAIATYAVECCAAAGVGSIIET